MREAASQLLRALRGPRSQVQLARRLGYRANPITDWEHGRQFPTAAEALRVARLCRVDVEGAVSVFAPEAFGAYGVGDDAGVAAWMRALAGDRSAASIGDQMGRTRFAVRRWLQGGARPRLPEFLQLIDALTGRVTDFVGSLVPIDQVAALAARHRAVEAGRRIAIDMPWAVLVLRTLETQAYQGLRRHDAAWVASRLGLELATVERSLLQLVESGQVRWTGSHYEACEPLVVVTRAEPTANPRVKAHWADVARTRLLGTPGEHDLFNYIVFACSGVDLETVRSIERDAMKAIRAVVGASEPCEVVGLVNLQLAVWDMKDPQVDRAGRSR